MKKNVSLKDIAEDLGVSTSLVSYVLNGHARTKRVAVEVEKKVLDTAKKLNYQPNQIAKSLKTRKSNTIGLIVADIHYRYTTGITRSIEAGAKEKNHHVIFGNSHEDIGTLHELIHVFLNRQADGLIIVAAENAEAEIRYLKKREVPFVLIDRNFPSVKANFIGIDNYLVAYNATNYLVERGRKQIAFINYDTSFFHLKERNRGYTTALAAHGLTPKQSLLKEIRKTHFNDDLCRALAELTGETGKCDAIFFATDTLAVRGLSILMELNVQIPEKIAVFSFDESEAFALFRCPVTHYRQPLEEIGKAAVNLLYDLMENPRPPSQLCLDSALVVGKSCGEK